MGALLNINALRSVLQTRIKPELNKLYTESPKFGADDGDWGWFCKEHALHCYFLAKLIGYTATIRRGDFTARKPVDVSQRLDGISSVGSDSDHVWCQIDEIVPVDLSANFEFFGGTFPWIDIVFGPNSVGGASVRYFVDSASFTAQNDSSVNCPVFAYLEKHVVRLDDMSLLYDPYLLLFKAKTGGFGDAYGHDIFNKITLHLFDVALGTADRLMAKGRNVAEALNVIRERYPNATETLSRQFGN